MKLASAMGERGGMLEADAASICWEASLEAKTSA